MPSFYIQSLVERQLQKYRERHARVRMDLDGFVLYAGLLGGKEVGDVFQGYIDNVRWYWRYRGERLPEIPAQGLPFLDEFLQLNRQESALVIKMRNTAFWCHDSMAPPYVLWCYGLRWYDIEALVDEEGCMPPDHVEKVLRRLLDEEPKFPTAKDVASFGMAADAIEGWARTFRHRRRNLVWLFQTALRLDQAIIYSTI